MQIKIKRIDTTLPLPEYHTAGAAAFDFYARETCTVPAHGLFKIPSNLIIETPPGWALIVCARSSLAGKKGLFPANGVGVIDNDYCGPEDEIKLPVYNFTDAVVTVERGERVAQGMFIKIDRAEWVEVQAITSKSRGGFGSTG